MSSIMIKKNLFKVIPLIITFFLIELLSFAVWSAILTHEQKHNVKILSSEITPIYRWVPNAFWHHDINPDFPDEGHIINSMGTRGSDFEMPKPKGELRIMCVGDSTVAGYTLPPVKTFPHFLEESLKGYIRKIPGYEKVKVINAGVGAHNSAYTLSYLALRLIHYDPDIVIIKSSYNDYLPFLRPGMEYDYTHAYKEPFNYGVQTNGYWRVARYSYFLKVLGCITLRGDVNNPNKSFFGGSIPENLQEADFKENEDKFHVYGENIKSMIYLLRERGIKVYALDLPTSPDKSHYGRNKMFGVKYKKLIGRLESELRDVAEEEEVPFIATGPLLEKEDFWDHCHNTVSGNRKIAKSIFRIIVNDL